MVSLMCSFEFVCMKIVINFMWNIYKLLEFFSNKIIIISWGLVYLLEIVVNLRLYSDLKNYGFIRVVLLIIRLLIINDLTNLT